MTKRSARVHAPAVSRAPSGPAGRAWPHAGAWVLGLVLVMGAGVAAEAADALGEATLVRSLLDRPVTFNARHLRRVYLANLMQMFIRPEDGEGVVALRGDPQDDTAAIRCQQRP